MYEGNGEEWEGRDAVSLSVCVVCVRKDRKGDRNGKREREGEWDRE